MKNYSEINIFWDNNPPAFLKVSCWLLPCVFTTLNFKPKANLKQLLIKRIPFSTTSEISSGLQASGPLLSIDHIHSTGNNTVLSAFIQIRLPSHEDRENAFGTENPSQMPSEYIIHLAWSSGEAVFILGSALCQCILVWLLTCGTHILPVQSTDTSTHLLAEDHKVLLAVIQGAVL